MFKQAIRIALKTKKKTYQWLSDEAGITIHSIKQYMSKCPGSNLSIGRVEKIFKVLGIGLKLPKE